MLKLTVTTEENCFTCDSDAINDFLAEEGIEFGSFSLTKHTKEVIRYPVIPDEIRSDVISHYKKQVATYSALAGYRADVICLSPEMDYLDYVLKAFKDIHFHFENEYWYILDGSCGYGYLGKCGRKYIVTIPAGYFVSVPEGKWQWIIPPEDCKMKAMRFFNTTGRITQPPALRFSDLHEA